jgi:Ca-activated chloride channel family protein
LPASSMRVTNLHRTVAIVAIQLTLLCLTSFGQPAKRTQPSQEPAEPEGETIKISTEMVQVAFAVVDGQNRLVKDLKASEVEVYDGGQRQKLELFRRTNSVPIMLSILIDKSASQEAVLNYEKNAIDVFLDSYFRPGVDFCSLGSFQWKLALSCGLTSNHHQLKSALRAIDREQVFRDEEGGVPLLGTALYDAIINTVEGPLSGRTSRSMTGADANPRAASAGGDNRPEATTERRAIRRAIVLLTDGSDTASQASLEDVIKLCQKRGIGIYALGIGDVSRQRQVNNRVLERLTLETGGMAFYPTREDEIERYFQRVMEALSSLYMVAYYPSGGDARSGYRRLEIKVNDRPDVRVIHRNGYESEAR